jgi:hypothetical protein
MEVKGQLHVPAALPLGTGGWVDPRTALDDVVRRKTLPLPGLELRLLSRPTRSESLYRLRYHGFPSSRPLQLIIHQ